MKKCECPLNCGYCGRRRSKDSVGHYCKTQNCQWQHGYSTCELTREETKLEKVIRFVRLKKNGSFTWKRFVKAMECQYPSAETNYLSMLVKAQYLARTARGQYEVWCLPGHGISYAQLKRESQLNFNSTTDYLVRAKAGAPAIPKFADPSARATSVENED